MDGLKPCRHCGVKLKYPRPRQLCWSHYYDRAVRDLYPSTNKFGYRGPRGSDDAPEAEPTDAVPGSEEKIRVLAERLSRGQALHARGDLWHETPAPVEIRTVRVEGDLLAIAEGQSYADWCFDFVKSAPK
jgi:hypothetical protein